VFGKLLCTRICSTLGCHCHTANHGCASLRMFRIFPDCTVSYAEGDGECESEGISKVEGKWKKKGQGKRING